MPITCIGLSHRTAPIEVRERHAFPASRMAEALVALRDYEAVREAVMLQTCGRLEIYAELDDYERGVGTDQIVSRELPSRHDRLRYRVVPLYAARTSGGRASLPRLHRARLDAHRRSRDSRASQGRVRRGDARKLARPHAPPPLSRGARGRQDGSRADASIGGESVSMATAAVEAARVTAAARSRASPFSSSAPARWDGLRSSDCARRAPIGSSSRIARCRARADSSPKPASAKPSRCPSSRKRSAVADVVVASTGASHFVLDEGCVRAAMARRPDRPLFIVDIAVPRDVDPAVANVANVSLVDIDGLKSVVNERLDLRREAIPAVEEIIARIRRALRKLVSFPRRRAGHRTTDAKSRGDPRRRARAAPGALPELGASANACWSPA